MKLIESLRRNPPAVALQPLFAHAVLLAATLRGGLPYIVLHGLIAFERALSSLVAVPLVPERGLLAHRPGRPLGAHGGRAFEKWAFP